MTNIHTGILDNKLKLCISSSSKRLTILVVNLFLTSEVKRIEHKDDKHNLQIGQLTIFYNFRSVLLNIHESWLMTTVFTNKLNSEIDTTESIINRSQITAKLQTSVV